MTGPVEEAGATARSIIDVLRSEPLSLALVVMNVLLLALFFYVIQTATSVRHAELERVFAAQEKTNQLLYNCVPRSNYTVEPLKPLGEVIEPHKP